MLGSKAETDSVLANIASACGTTLAPILLAGLPHKTLSLPGPSASLAGGQQSPAALPGEVAAAAVAVSAGLAPAAGVLENVHRDAESGQVKILWWCC